MIWVIKRVLKRNRENGKRRMDLKIIPIHFPQQNIWKFNKFRRFFLFCWYWFCWRNCLEFKLPMSKIVVIFYSVGVLLYFGIYSSCFSSTTCVCNVCLIQLPFCLALTNFNGVLSIVFILFWFHLCRYLERWWFDSIIAYEQFKIN